MWPCGRGEDGLGIGLEPGCAGRASLPPAVRGATQRFPKLFPPPDLWGGHLSLSQQGSGRPSSGPVLGLWMETGQPKRTSASDFKDKLCGWPVLHCPWPRRWLLLHLQSQPGLPALPLCPSHPAPGPHVPSLLSGLPKDPPLSTGSMTLRHCHFWSCLCPHLPSPSPCRPAEPRLLWALPPAPFHPHPCRSWVSWRPLLEGSLNVC